MSDHQTVIYHTYRATLDNGQQVLVQIFSDNDTHKPLKAQMSFRAFTGDTWGQPYPLELGQ